ncbi:MAG: CYTH domain-containing protein [Clostridiales bacterium]|nr:CYTH domain-containing protein [Clostridiales bacterium]
MTEREYKYLVGEEELRLVEKVLESEQQGLTEKVQINYYYDTMGGDLRRRGITLRVRQTGGRLSLQYKRRLDTGDIFRVSEEVSLPLERLCAAIRLPDKLFPRYDAAGREEEPPACVLQGSLTTWRRSYLLKGGITVELDRSSYLGVYDCEIEVEFPDGKENEAKQLTARLGLRRIPCSKEGKAERFFKLKKRVDDCSITVREQ